VFRTLVEELAPAAVAELVGSVGLPLPRCRSIRSPPPGRQGDAHRPPAELVTGEPPARMTLYGRFLAQ
jgi:hypothetical protein